MNGDYPVWSAVCYRRCFLLSYIEILIWKPCQCFSFNSLNWMFHHCLIHSQHIMMLLLYNYWLGPGATVVLFWREDRNIAGRQRQWATVEFEGHTNRCCPRTQSKAVLLYLIIWFYYWQTNNVGDLYIQLIILFVSMKTKYAKTLVLNLDNQSMHSRKIRIWVDGKYIVLFFFTCNLLKERGLY